MKKPKADNPIIHKRQEHQESIIIQIKLKTRGANGKLQFSQSKSITVQNISFDNALARVQRAFT